MAATQSFHKISVDGNEITLRVFVPGKPPAAGGKPAVVMVCGLLWLGEGLLGLTGLTFNDKFGFEFAKNGVPCVQIHTPSRHLAHTRIMDATVALLWPLCFIPALRVPLLVLDLLLLAVSKADLCTVLLVPFLRKLGPVALIAGHVIMRALHYVQGSLPAPMCRSHQREIAAAVAWAQKNQDLLGSDGRLALCGYSSGGHCATLYALSAAAPRFESVVLISGLYNLRTHAWQGCRRLLAPIFNVLFKDILGVATDEDRDRESPEFMASKAAKSLQGQPWYILSASMELMGLEPFQDILFNAEPLSAALRTAGAKVERVRCGLNHWLLVLNVGDFIRPYCEGL